MTIQYFSFTPGLAWGGPHRTTPVLMVGDTDAERPPDGMIEGDQFLAKDTGTLYKATGPTTWLEVGEVGRPREERLFKSGLAIMGQMVLTGRDIYWVYIGQITKRIKARYAEVYATSGIGDILIDFGLASTPLPPNMSSQTLTVLKYVGTVRNISTPGVLRLDDMPFDYHVAPGTYLWVGVKIDPDPGAAAPDVLALGYDMGQGQVLQTKNAGFGSPTYVGSIIPASASPICPHVVLTLD